MESPWDVWQRCADEAVEAEQEQQFGPEVARYERFHPRWDPGERRILGYDEVVQPTLPLDFDD
jgi:hypothetical protein